MICRIVYTGVYVCVYVYMYVYGYMCECVCVMTMDHWICTYMYNDLIMFLWSGHKPSTCACKVLVNGN